MKALTGDEMMDDDDEGGDDEIIDCSGDGLSRAGWSDADRLVATACLGLVKTAKNSVKKLIESISVGSDASLQHLAEALSLDAGARTLLNFCHKYIQLLFLELFLVSCDLLNFFESCDLLNFFVIRLIIY